MQIPSDEKLIPVALPHDRLRLLPQTNPSPGCATIQWPPWSVAFSTRCGQFYRIGQRSISAAPFGVLFRFRAWHFASPPNIKKWPQNKVLEPVHSFFHLAHGQGYL